MEIRFLESNDGEAFWELRLEGLRDQPEAFGSSYQETLARPPQVRLEQFQQNVAKPDKCIIGAWANGKLVGVAGLRREEGMKERHKAGIWGVYVTPSARGRGVGRALLEAVIQQARTIPNLEQLSLGVGTNNIAARNLYLSLGFQVYGTEPHALKVDNKNIDEDLMVYFL